MEIGCGQKYDITAPGIAIPVTGSSFDLWVVTAAPNVPVLIERAVVTCNYDAAGTLAVQLVKRSASGSGGSAMTIAAEPTSAPAASMSANWGVTTLGAVKATMDPEYWQLFSSWEMNRRPGALLITPGESLALNVPGGNAFTALASIHIEAIEVK